MQSSPATLQDSSSDWRQLKGYRWWKVSAQRQGGCKWDVEIEERMGQVTLHKEGMCGGAGMQCLLWAADIIPELFPLLC